MTFYRQKETIRYYEMDALVQVNHDIYIYRSAAGEWAHFKNLN